MNDFKIDEKELKEIENTMKDLASSNRNVSGLAIVSSFISGAEAMTQPNPELAFASFMLCLGSGVASMYFWKQYQKEKANLHDFVNGKTLQEKIQNYRE